MMWEAELLQQEAIQNDEWDLVNDFSENIAEIDPAIRDLHEEIDELDELIAGDY